MSDVDMSRLSNASPGTPALPHLVINMHAIDEYEDILIGQLAVLRSSINPSESWPAAIPDAIGFLKDTTCPQDTESDENYARILTLDILYTGMRYVESSVAIEVFALVLELIQTDNHLVGSKALEVSFRILKDHADSLGQAAAGFLDVILGVFKAYTGEVDGLTLGKPSAALVSQCALPLMLLFKTQPSVHKQAASTMNMLVAYVSISIDSASIASRVKSLITLAYLARTVPVPCLEVLSANSDTVITALFDLLGECSTLHPARLDLLNAFRQLYSPEPLRALFMPTFLIKFDSLIAPGGLSSVDDDHSTRNLALTVVSEIVFFLRDQLSLDRINVAVHQLSIIVHEPGLSRSTQIASIRVLHSLVDNVFKSAEDHRVSHILISKILHCCVAKLESLNCAISQSEDWTDSIVKQTKELVYQIVFRLKSTVWCLVNSKVCKSYAIPFLYTDEATLLGRLLVSGLGCMALYQKFPLSSGERAAPPLELFASSFTSLDPRAFQPVFNDKMEVIFSQIVALPNVRLVTVVEFFLQAKSISVSFGDMLMYFLCDRISVLTDSTNPEAAVVAELFELIISSVFKCPGGEESIRPYLKKITTVILELASSSLYIDRLLTILRRVFEVTQEGQFESLLKEIMPLLTKLIPLLLSVAETHPQESARHDAVHLCLIVPATLSSKLPFMASFVRAMWLGLTYKMSNEKPLKELLYWVDNVDLEYLCALLEPYMKDVMMELFAILNDSESPREQQIAMNILGKFGGMNRSFMTDSIDFDYTDVTENGLSVVFECPMDEGDSQQLTLQCSPIVKSCTKLLYSGSSLNNGVRHSTYNMLRYLLASLLEKPSDGSRISVPLQDDIGEIPEPYNIGRAETFEVLTDASVVEQESHTVRRKPYRQAEEAILRSILTCLLRNAHLEEDDGNMLVICDHFSFLYCSTHVNSKSPKMEGSSLDENVFVLALCDHLCSSPKLENTRFITRLLDQIISLVGLESASHVRAIDSLLNELCHRCHSPMADDKYGACLGLGKLMEALPAKWTCDSVKLLFRSIIATFTDEARSELNQSKYAHAVQLLSSLVDIVVEDMATISILKTDLAASLISPVVTVRETSLDLLRKVAEKTETTMAAVLGEYREQFMVPVTRTFHQIPSNTRTGYMSAITACLEARDPMLKFDQSFQDLITETIRDCIDVGEPHGSGYAPTERGGVKFRLRIQNLRFLAAVIASPELHTSTDEFKRIHESIVKVLFNCLTSRDQELVAVAKAGLQSQAQPLPRETLKLCIKPIIESLGDASKLNVRLLKLLALLLELLSPFFHENIGDRLLTNLRNYILRLRDAVRSGELKPTDSSMQLTQHSTTQIQIPTSIIELFHLLPNPSEKVLPLLVDNVLALEDILGQICINATKEHFSSGSGSPFRVPLFKYCQKKPAQTLDYFLDPPNLLRPDKRGLFLQLLTHPECNFICALLMETAAIRLATPLKLAAGPNASDLETFRLSIVRVLAEENPEWMGRALETVESLVIVFRNRVKLHAGTLPISQIGDLKLIVKCLVHFLEMGRGDPASFEVAWQLVSALATPYVVDFQDLGLFFSTTHAQLYSGSDKARALDHILGKFHNSDPSVHAAALQYLVIPMLESEEEDVDDIITDEGLKALLSLVADKFIDTSSEGYVSMVLKLFSIVTDRSERLSASRVASKVTNLAKRVIENEQSKRSQEYAFLYLARSTNGFKDALSLYEQFLAFASTSHSDPESLASNPVINSTMDTLLSLFESESDWVGVTTSMITSDWHSMAKLNHVWSALVRHDKLVFENQSSFVELIISALPMLGIGTRDIFLRNIALDLVAMILSWAGRTPSRSSSRRASKRRKRGDGSAAETAVYILPEGLKTLALSVLCKMALFSKETCNRTIEITKSALQLWSDVDLESICSPAIIQSSKRPELMLPTLMMLLETNDSVFLERYIDVSCAVLQNSLIRSELSEQSMQLLSRLLSIDEEATLIKVEQMISELLLACLKTDGPIDVHFVNSALRVWSIEGLRESFGGENITECLTILSNLLVKSLTELENPPSQLLMLNVLRVFHGSLPESSMDTLLSSFFSVAVSSRFSDLAVQAEACECLSAWIPVYGPARFNRLIANTHDFSNACEKDHVVRLLKVLADYLSETPDELATLSGDPVFTRIALIGAQVIDPDLRRQYLLYLTSLEPTLESRLSLELGNVSEHLSLVNWIPVATSFFLDYLGKDSPVIPDENTCLVACPFTAHAGGERSPSHLNSIRDFCTMTSGEFISELQVVLCSDMALASKLWVHYYSQLCTSASLTENVQGYVATKVLEAVSMSRIARTIEPSIIEKLTTECGAWFAGIQLLSVRSDEDSVKTLERLYTHLNEEDVLSGLYTVNPQHFGFTARASLALQQFRLWHRARDVLFTAMGKSLDSGLDNYTSIERDWVHCLKNMNRWDTLSAYSESVKDSRLNLECSVKLNKWKNVKDLLSLASEEEATSPMRAEINSLPYRARLEIAAVYSKLRDAPSGASFTEAAGAEYGTLFNTLIKEWKRYPRECLGDVHLPMLSAFQQVAEMRESHTMIRDTSNVPRTIELWQSRLPCEWQDIPVWNDIFGWRLDTFERLKVSMALPIASTEYLKTHDIPWTIVKLAEVSREHLLPSVALETLACLDNLATMESDNAFNKVKELVEVVMQLTSELRLAYSIISRVNLDYFDNLQKSELFRLKGEVLQQLGLGDESHAAFSAATSVCESNGKAWSSWASFCDRVFSLKKAPEWADYAVSCYLQAVIYGDDKAKLMLTRVLWLLSFDTIGGPVIQSFENFASRLPLWVWLLWVPQLLSSLARFEGEQVYNLLREVSRFYPQAVYYTVRAFLIEKRDLHAIYQKQVQQTGGEDPGPNPEQGMSALLHSENLIKSLQQNHQSMLTEIERMLDEIVKHLKPEPEEELLGAVNTLFIRCFRQPVSSPDTVPRSLTHTIERVFSKFFTRSDAHTHDAHRRFIDTYRNRFECDFLPSSSEFPRHLTELMRRLKRWKSHLQYCIGGHRKDSVKLESLSRHLSHFTSNDIEIPGQYLSNSGEEPSVGHHVLIAGFTSDVYIHRSHGFSPRRIGMRGSDGKVYQFLVQYSLAHLMRSQERMMQLHSVVNRLLTKYIESERRHLAFKVRLTIPLTHRLRLVQTDECEISLEDIYAHTCALEGLDTDLPLTVYRNTIGSVAASENNAKARRDCYDSITGSVVRSDGLERYMSQSLISLEQLWTFKKHFAQQMAMSSFLSYTMKVGDRVPYKISFSRRSGCVINSEFYPCYNSSGMVELNEDVPFRLTPNLSNFMTPHIVHGVFGTTLLSLAACLLKHQDVLKNYMYVFFRDDLLSFLSSNMVVVHDSKQQKMEIVNREKVSSNTFEVLQRIQSIMPETTGVSV